MLHLPDLNEQVSAESTLIPFLPSPESWHGVKLKLLHLKH